MIRRTLGHLAQAAVAIGLMLALFAALYSFASQMYSAPFLRSSGASPSSLIVWTLHDPYPPSPEYQFDLAAQSNTSALALVGEAALRSSVLVLLAAALAVALGTAAGFWLALYAPRRLGALLETVATVGGTVPGFFVAFLLQIGAVELAQASDRTIVPTYGFGLDGHLVIPVLALAAAPLAYVVRLVALSVRELGSRDFVRGARAKGLPERVIAYRHIAPNMSGTLGEATVGAVRLVVASLLIVEYLLVWPGIGNLLLRAIVVQDFAVLALSVGLIGTLLLLSEVALDLIARGREMATG